MSVLVNKDSKVIFQGITGSFGSRHARACIDYGTQVVGGVVPGREVAVQGHPVADVVREQVEPGLELARVEQLGLAMQEALDLALQEQVLETRIAHQARSMSSAQRP